jgi:hypothetical protein
MFYTRIPPTRGTDRTHLYQDIDSALTDAHEDERVFAVAVHFDERERKVTSLWAQSRLTDPDWVAPTERHADGSITVKGTIPASLYMEAPRIIDPFEAMILGASAGIGERPR